MILINWLVKLGCRDVSPVTNNLQTQIKNLDYRGVCTVAETLPRKPKY